MLRSVELYSKYYFFTMTLQIVTLQMIAHHFSLKQSVQWSSNEDHGTPVQSYGLQILNLLHREVGFLDIILVSSCGVEYLLYCCVTGGE